MPDVTALVSQMNETLAQIHETIAGLDTAEHDSKLDALEEERESAIQALHESFELESADLDSKRKSRREEIAEQRRKEDEEREARRRREDEELTQNEEAEDEQRQVKLQEQTEDIDEQTDAKMDEVEEEAHRRLEEGERRLVELEEKRKEINRLIDEQMRAPLPPPPVSRKRTRTSLSRGAAAATSRSVSSEMKSKTEVPAAEEKSTTPALVDRSIPVADEIPTSAVGDKSEEKPAFAVVEGKSASDPVDKSVPVADEKPKTAAEKSAAVADQKPTPAAEKPAAAADEMPTAVIGEKPEEKSAPGLVDEPIPAANEKPTPTTEEKPATAVDETPTAVVEEKAEEKSAPALVGKAISVADEKPAAGVDEIPTPDVKEQPEEKTAAAIEEQLAPAATLAAEAKPTPVPEEKPETAGSRDIKAVDTATAKEAPVDALVSAAKVDEHSAPSSAPEPLPEEEAAEEEAAEEEAPVDQSEAPKQAPVIEPPKEDKTAKSETKLAEEHTPEVKANTAPGAAAPVETSEDAVDEAPEAAEVTAKQDAETSHPSAKKQDDEVAAASVSVTKDAAESERLSATPLANAAAVPETSDIPAPGLVSDVAVKAAPEAEILEKAPEPTSPLEDLDLKIKSSALNEPPAANQVEPPVPKEANETTEPAGVTLIHEPPASAKGNTETPATSAVDDGIVRAGLVQASPVHEPAAELPSEVQAVSEPVIEPVATSKETDSHTVAPTPPSPGEAAQPGSVESSEEAHVEHQAQPQQEVTKVQEAKLKTEAGATDISVAQALHTEESIAAGGQRGSDSVLDLDTASEQLNAMTHDIAGPIAVVTPEIAEVKQLGKPALAEKPEHDNVPELKRSETEVSVDSEFHDDYSTEPESALYTREFDFGFPAIASNPPANDLETRAEGSERSLVASQIKGADDKPLSTEPAAQEAATDIRQAEEREEDESSKSDKTAEIVTDNVAKEVPTHDKPTELLDHDESEEAAAPEEPKEAKLETAPVAPASALSADLGAKPSAAPDVAKVEDAVKTGAPVGAGGPIKAQDVVEIKGTAKPEVAAGTEKPVTAEEHIKAEEPVKAEEAAKTEEPTKSQEAIEIKDTAKAEEAARTEEPVKAEEPIKAEEAAKADEPVKADEAAKAEEPVKDEETVKSGEPVKAGEAAKAEVVAKVDETLNARAADTQEAAVAAVQAPMQDEAPKPQDPSKEAGEQLPVPDIAADIATPKQVVDGSQVLTAAEKPVPPVAVVDSEDSHSEASSSGSAFEFDNKLSEISSAHHAGEAVAPMDISDLSSLTQSTYASHEDLVASDAEYEAPQHALAPDASLNVHSASMETQVDTAKTRQAPGLGFGAASGAIPLIEAPAGQQEAAKGQTVHIIPASFAQYESAHEESQYHDSSDHHGAAGLAPLDESPAAVGVQEPMAVPHIGQEADTRGFSEVTNPQAYAAPLQHAIDLQAQPAWSEHAPDLPGPVEIRGQGNETHEKSQQASAMEESTATVSGTDDLFESDSEGSDQSSHGAKAQHEQLEHQAATGSTGQEHVGQHDMSTALESPDAHEPASPAGVPAQTAPEAKPKDTAQVAPADSRPDLTVMTEPISVSPGLPRNIEEDLRTPRALPEATSEQPGAAPMPTPHLAPAAAVGHNEDISPLMLRNQSPIASVKGLAASRHAPRPDSLEFTPLRFPAEVVVEHDSPSRGQSQELGSLEADKHEHHGQQLQGWEQSSLEQHPLSTPRAPRQDSYTAEHDSPDAPRGRSTLASELEQASGGEPYGQADDEMDPDMFVPRDVTHVPWHARTDSVPASLHSRTTLSSAPSSPIHAALQQDNHEPVIRDSWAVVPQSQQDFLAGVGGGLAI
ncbi:hypothetical protein MAPG_01562 [Magnaporthiopsis poae ATCC 64411]|uniref:Uncharacterized protein n=1 Tax=Magnaporthiopsis poae (strain ATCC 64411 / 73-15) TaxID=644358 RepID=A0A0C4DP12_MAGP6|nr:hypothetical protein MAPG_01562 [Magnaporthiopsis poae ATCC 64411]